jgi:hypothetical protein
MIVPTRAELSQEGNLARQNWSRRVLGAAPVVLVACLLFSINVWLASIRGVFRSELNGESDEPAHYVTALMIRDYIAQGIPAKPLAFAKNYYLHYPKVAFGHWPPLFHVVEAAWMLIFGVSRTSVMCLALTITTLLGATLHAVVSRAFGYWQAGLAAAILFICLPLVQSYSGLLMADTLVALLSFWTILLWARYMEAPSWPVAIAFALLSIATILTKGNGFALALVPPITIVLCRRWELMKQPSLYGSAILIVAGTLPWHFVTFGLIAPTFEYKFSFAFTASATWFLWGQLLRAPGILVSAFGFIGMAARVIRPYWLGRVEPLWGAAFAQVIAVWLFHALVPAGMEFRYILASFAPWLMFAAAGIQWVSERLRGVMLPARGWAIGLSVIALAVFFVTVFKVPQKLRLGFQEAAEEVTSNPEFRNSVILCSSDGVGEGAFISEVAMHEARPGHIILRASRMLADSDWNGRYYRVKMEEPAMIQQFLETAAVDLVVLDLNPYLPLKHHQLLRATMHAPGWRRIGVYPRVVDSLTDPKARVEVWKQTGIAKPAPTFTLEMNPTPRISVETTPSH